MYNVLKTVFNTDNLCNIRQKYYKKDTRNNKLNINDILAYMLTYTSKTKTKLTASQNINYDTQKNVSVNAFYEQSKKYGLSFYEDILNKLNKEYLKITDNKKSINFIIRNRLSNIFIDDSSIDIKKFIYMLVDGTCNNSYKNSKLQTTNTLYFYDYLNNICIGSYTKKKLYGQKKKTKNITLTKTGKEKKI